MNGMKRDGACTSLWQDKMPDYVSKTKTLTQNSFDVVIAGGGVTGIATAVQLQKAGLKCLIVEAHNLCFGTSGGTTAHLNSFFDTAYQQIESKFGEDSAQLVARAASQALELYCSNIEQYNIDCGYQQKDGYVYSQNDQQTEELQKMFDASKKAGVDVAYTDRIPVPFTFKKAIVYHEQANIHPAKYVYALATVFEESGGAILQNCRVKKVEGGDMLSIDTSIGNVQTKKFIWATHIPPGINLLHFRCAPYRSYVIAVTLNDDAYPDGLAYDMYDPYHYYRTQIIDGEKYLIVGGEDHKTAHEENTEFCFNRLEAHVRTCFNVKEISFKWSSQYFEPADGLAYIGHLPGNPKNVFVATGFGGNGMMYSHIAAITLTELITKDESEFAKVFDPNRLKPVAGFSNFVKENLDVVKEFFGKRLSKEKMEELSDISNGEGKLVKFEGKSLALYKDEKGEIHAVNPTCPHAKCAVGWNSAEKSWDCPCHGSRFSVDGEMLTGPSVANLEVVKIENLVQEEKH